MLEDWQSGRKIAAVTEHKRINSAMIDYILAESVVLAQVRCRRRQRETLREIPDKWRTATISATLRLYLIAAYMRRTFIRVIIMSGHSYQLLHEAQLLQRNRATTLHVWWWARQQKTVVDLVAFNKHKHQRLLETQTAYKIRWTCLLFLRTCRMELSAEWPSDDNWH